MSAIPGAIATFADAVSPTVRAAVAATDELVETGRLRDALDQLRGAAASLPTDVSGDDDRIVLGETAAYAFAGSVLRSESLGFMEGLARSAVGARAQGALHFHRGRIGIEAEDLEYLRQALGDFTRARDTRGMAVTLVTMSWPTKAVSSPEQRRRMAREGLALAHEHGDPWVIAYCSSKVGTSRTYLGDVGALDDFRVAEQHLFAVADPATAHLALLNQLNWGLSAFALARYDEARRIFADGRLLAVTPVWLNRFEGGIRLVDWRTGHDLQARAPRAAGGLEIHSIVDGAAELYAARRISTERTEVLGGEMSGSAQLRWLACALQARMRAARNEPNPLRAIPAAIALAVQTESRVGWEDVVLTAAELDAELGAGALTQVDGLWPDLPRATAVRLACQALVASDAGRLLGAADLFLTLQEPATAARLLLRAADTCSSTREGNPLRMRALELFRAVGDQRACAEVLRARTLHRGPSYASIPSEVSGSGSAGLTRREREVVELSSQGLTAAEIAEHLSLSVWTVRHHIQHARTKLGGVTKRQLGQLFTPANA